MTSEQFRSLALGLPGVTEKSHQAHPDFRAHGRIFATLHWPDESWGMLKLALSYQEHLTRTHPYVFIPVKGKWGANGSTNVLLRTAKVEVARYALELAWQNSAAVVARKQK